MRNLLLPTVASALLASCAIVSDRTEIRSTVELVDGGRATGTIEAGESNTIDLTLTNSGVSVVKFDIKDDLGRQLDQGQIRRGSHAFSWRPMGRKVVVQVSASGTASTRLEYQLSSFGPVSIGWDLTYAQRAAQP